MQKYSEWAPTAFDPKGLNLDDRQDWLVLGLIRTRDSGTLAESNFATALNGLGGEGETVEVHRFGHWGPGWFEIILLHPSREPEGQAIEDQLENYCVLDEEDLSQREMEAQEEDWKSWAHGDWVKKLVSRFEEQLDEEEVEKLEESDWELSDVMDFHPGGYFATSEESGTHFDFGPAVEVIALADIRDKIKSGYDFEDGTRGPYCGMSCLEAHDMEMAQWKRKEG